MTFSLRHLAELADERSRSITAENPDGSPGSGGQAASDLGPGRKGRPAISVEPGETATLADVDGPGEITHIWMTTRPTSDAGDYVFRDLVVRMYWDDEDDPSVEVPLGDLFCCGHGVPAEVDSLPVAVAPVGGLNLYFPMPFRDRARITVESEHPTGVPLFYQIDYSLDADVADAAYFHAQWRRENPTERGRDYTILEAEGRGHYVGTYLAWTALANEWWGEGEFKCYVDGDEEYPTICGTGTEDYVGGAWGFGEDYAGGTYSTAFLGYPLNDRNDDRRGSVPRHGLYRWHVPDPIRFREDLRAEIQVIGFDGHDLFERSDDVSSVAYWYQTEPHAPFPALPDREGRRPR